MKVRKHKHRFWSWQLFAFIALVLFVVYMEQLLGMLPRALEIFGGQRTTAHFVARYEKPIPKLSPYQIKSYYRVIEAYYYDKDKTLHMVEVYAQPELYNRLKEEDPVEIVYSPSQPKLAYTLDGQGMTPWMWWTQFIAIVTILPAVFVRYKRTLMKKLW